MNALDVLALAKKHSVKKDTAAPDFFEGALLGNGDLGVVVCTRPDGIVLHFGHNDIWDVRINEDHKDKIGTFKEIWTRIVAEKEDFKQKEWFCNYRREVTASYGGYKYPRPYPAGSLYLFFDRKEYEVLGHSLDLSDGLLTVTLQDYDEKKYDAQIFVSQTQNVVYCRTVDEQGRAAKIFHRMYLSPTKPDEGIPDYTVLENGVRQLLPHNEYAGQTRPGVDKGFSVLYQTDGTHRETGLRSLIENVTEVVVQVTEGYYDEVCKAETVQAVSFEEAFNEAKASWKKYWERSGIQLEDEFLEHLWYFNTYLMRCVLNDHSTCPGLFGNWMYGNIGVAWHGDYHMNYNTQQIFWGLMASNRQELHLPYVKLAEDLLPLSKGWAKDFYKLRGACFPHSAYPVPMTVMPYPSPNWGWEIFETPWTVQSLWWHYTYTKDTELLRNRLYPVIREAALFLVDYMTREGANPNQDEKYHLFPTVVPELYGLSEGLTKNLDGAVDLTFTKFIFRAVLQAVEDLGLEEQELTEKIRMILNAFPDYPTADSRWGEVYVSVQTEDPEKVIYNCPANLMQIFPGEDVDAQSASEKELQLAGNSWRHHYNEGGNDIVFYHLIGARLGMLNLEQFKRHVRYCQMPNETVADRVTLAGGRVSDDRPLDYMCRMGVWVENFSLYAVVNECLLWGHREVVELFPNWDKQKSAAFRSLRTKGAFLVDSACSAGEVEYVRVCSECGGIWKLKNPWPAAIDQNGKVYTDSILEIPMTRGETINLKKA